MKQIFQQTDLGNAERLIDHFGDLILYSTARKSWYIWDLTKWKRDDEQRIMVFAKETVQSIMEEVSNAKSSTKKNQLRIWAKRSAGQNYRNNMVRSAQPMVAIREEQWNADKNLFNCLNGTLEIESLTLREFRREDYITKQAGVEYDQQAECPTWKDHLSLIFEDDQESINGFQMLCGYILLGGNPQQLFAIMHGNGANGKSVTLNVLSKIFCDYAVNVAPETLMVTRRSASAPSSDVVRMAGARLITSTEGEESDRLSSKLIKQVTGGDTITARRLYENDIEIKVDAVILYATNHKPEFTPDYAMERRLLLIPFDVTIPEKQRNPKIQEKLIEEKSGIFNWMIKGAKAYYANGSVLFIPEKFSSATKQYKEENDQVGRFIKDCCVIESDEAASKIMRPVLWATYEKWCKDLGEQPLTHKDFATRLQRHGVTKPDRGNRQWGCIRLKTEDDIPTFDL